MKAESIIQNLIQFGIVGIVAISVQAAVFFILASTYGFSGFVASTLSFVLAMLISYFGQSRWTFAARKQRSVLRFTVIALVSFAISSGGSWLLVDQMGYRPALMVPIIVIFVPLFSFILMRNWAFLHKRKG